MEKIFRFLDSPLGNKESAGKRRRERDLRFFLYERRKMMREGRCWTLQES